MRLPERLKKLIQIKGSSHRLASAFSLGVFLGILPGTGAVAAAGLAAVLGLNLPLAVAGAMVVNPITAPLVYVGSYFLGRWLLGDQVIEHKIARILLNTLAGSVVMALALAVVGYLIVWGLAIWHRRATGGRHAAGD